MAAWPLLWCIPPHSPSSCRTTSPSPKRPWWNPSRSGLQAASKARIAPGDLAVVIGAGPIGIMVALAALAGGCSRVIISDLQEVKLQIAGGYPGIMPVNIRNEKLADVVGRETDGWGADVVFEASGSPKAFEGLFALSRPGGCVVLVGMPVDPVSFDVVSAAAKEVRIETVFRYANVFDRALAMIASGRVNLKPLISATFPFQESVPAFERAAEGRPVT
jgi:D-xylulose reductase